jgi:hypothetical protein
MLRLTADTEKPSLADCIAHRCQAHAHVPAHLKGNAEAECGECVALDLTYQYAIGMEEERLDTLDALADALQVGAARNRACWTMADKVYEVIDRIRLHDPAWAEREYQTMVNEGALPPDRTMVRAMMMARYEKESPRG